MSTFNTIPEEELEAIWQQALLTIDQGLAERGMLKNPEESK